jgi:hypothetical protein
MHLKLFPSRSRTLPSAGWTKYSSVILWRSLSFGCAQDLSESTPTNFALMGVYVGYFSDSCASMESYRVDTSEDENIAVYMQCTGCRK